jgi:CheY-like chemotaxis protein
MNQFDSIFLVDDDPINNLINKRLLGKTGVTNVIKEFLDGEYALQVLSTIDPNQQVLIFLDINMPVMNGWDFLDRYMEIFPHRKDTILILSSSIDFQDKQKAIEYKVVYGFLEKPLTLEKIESLLT